MTITFEEAVFGTKNINKKDVTCHTCNGDGAKPGTSKKLVAIVMALVVFLLNKILFWVE